MKKLVEKSKIMLKEVYDYFKSLPLWGKVIFILVVLICKLGPDFILFPMLIKWVQAHKNNVENN